MPFVKCLDLVTNHVTESDRDRLNSGDGDCEHSAIRYCQAGEYGWIVWPPAIEGEDGIPVWPPRKGGADALRDALREEGWSEAFIQIVVIASEAECVVINFDRDAEHHADLPTFDW